MKSREERRSVSNSYKCECLYNYMQHVVTVALVEKKMTGNAVSFQTIPPLPSGSTSIIQSSLLY